MPGCSRIASTASLSPCTTLNTPGGRPASANRRARHSEADGSFSDGLRMNAFPQAMATGNIHIGTIAGKLNGVMPATTPTRLADRVAVDVRRDVLGELALEQLREAAGEVHDLEAAVHLAQRVGRHLAVLAGEEVGDLALVALDEFAEREHRCARAPPATTGPSRPAASAAASTAASTTPASAMATCAATRPVAGSNTSPQRPARPSHGLPPIQCVTVIHRIQVSLRGRPTLASSPVTALSLRPRGP